VIFLNRGGGQTPVIGKIDGDYQFDSRKTSLIWSLPVIDQSNSEGSLEFSVRGKAADFFPIQVDFVAETSFCDIKVNKNPNSNSMIFIHKLFILDCGC
jgi:hypothetical protein